MKNGDAKTRRQPFVLPVIVAFSTKANFHSKVQITDAAVYRDVLGKHTANSVR